MAECSPVDFFINVKYSQGWLSKSEEVAENKHAAWRTYPKKVVYKFCGISNDVDNKKIINHDSKKK